LGRTDSNLCLGQSPEIALRASLVPLLAALCLARPVAAADPARIITTRELAAKMTGPAARWSFTLVDARTEAEFSESHIEGAVLVPARLVAQKLPKLVKDRGRVVVFYCNGPNCTKTLKAAKAAASVGYTDLYEYKEGLPGWRKAGNKVEGSPLPRAEAPLISAQELAAALEAPNAPVVIDIRDEEEFDAFHISQARSVPLDDLARQATTFPAGRPLVVVDHAGHQASIAARVLATVGKTAVRRLDGGILKWQAAGLALTKSP
jgi:rhodanese-related sulfurtransferase